MTAQTSLGSLVQQAGNRARARQRPVLATAVERIPQLDPLGAIEAAVAAAANQPELEPLLTIRSYWTRPADGFAMAGLGAAVSFLPDTDDRFTAIDRGWTELLADAIVAEPPSGIPATGPTLIGGFSFDPNGPASHEWRDFPRGAMSVPALQITARGGDCWLTISTLVHPSGDAAIDPRLLTALRDLLLAQASLVTPTTGSAAAQDVLDYVAVRDASAWCATVQQAVAEIHAGAIEKVVLAREVRANATQDFDVPETIRQLRYAHPGCYVFGFWRGASAFVGATPERLVRVDGRDVQASSLAGSVRRGTTPAEDAERAQQLFASAKDRWEHEIVRRALCDGLASFCDDVTAADMPELLSLPQVHHLHTAIHARLRAGHSILQLVEQLHPTPAVGGAPRDAALRFIHRHEQMDRGWYAAPIGWMQRDRGEFAVGLRSALFAGNTASLFAGCGIVGDSVPDQEYAESELKLRPIRNALAAASSADDFLSDIAAAAAFSVESE